RVAIHDRGTEAASPELASIPPDLGSTRRECLPITKQVSIVIKVVNVDFEARGFEFVQELDRRLITLLGHDLKRRAKTKALVEVHQLPAKVIAALVLDIMGDRHRGGRAIRPEPYERHALAGSLHREREQANQEIIHGCVIRPAGEGNVS